MRRRPFRVAIMIVVAVGIFIGFCFAVRSLWNWLMPGIFGLPHIGFWQALGLLVLSRILFGGFRGWPGHQAPWASRMRNRWEGMSPEERERFQKTMGRRCGKSDVPEPGVPAT